MTKLFTDPPDEYNHRQHLQLVIDITPQHPLDKVDTEALIEKLKYNVDRGTVKSAFSIHAVSHPMVDCDEEMCLGVGRLVHKEGEE